MHWGQRGFGLKKPTEGLEGATESDISTPQSAQRVTFVVALGKGSFFDVVYGEGAGGFSVIFRQRMTGAGRGGGLWKTGLVGVTNSLSQLCCVKGSGLQISHVP